MKKSRFLESSISDIQSTIRALDTKSSILLVVSCIPIAGIEHFIPFCRDSCNISIVPVVFFVIGFLFWILSLLAISLTISPLFNPKDCIHGDIPKGLFFSGDLFNYPFFKKVFNNNLESKYTYNKHFERINILNEGDMLGELTFEQMKLCCVRDIKGARFRLSLLLTAVWIVCFLLFLSTRGFV